MPIKRDPVYLLTQAAKCRRLAQSTTDEMAARELLALAYELEGEANSEAIPSHRFGPSSGKETGPGPDRTPVEWKVRARTRDSPSAVLLP